MSEKIVKNYVLNPYILPKLVELKNEANIDLDYLYINKLNNNYILVSTPKDIDLWDLGVEATGEINNIQYFDFLLKKVLKECEILEKCLNPDSNKTKYNKNNSKNNGSYYSDAITDEVRLHKRLFYDEE